MISREKVLTILCNTIEDRAKLTSEKLTLISDSIAFLQKLNSSAIFEKITINSPNEYGNTALHYAVDNNHFDVVVKLLEAKANPNFPTKQNRITPLMFACENGNKDILSLLIEAGASLNCQNIDGNTALIIAAHANHPAITEQLIKSKAEVNIKNAEGNTALIFASSMGHNIIASQLIKADAFLDSQNLHGSTALMFASEMGHSVIASQLIEEGADIDIMNNDGLNALIYASREKREDITSQLIKAGAALNNQNNVGDTALILASYCGHETIVSQLIQAGANLELRSVTPLTITAIGWAIRNLDLITINLLLKAGAFVRDPSNLYRFLLTCDQRDFIVLNSLTFLYCQQRKLRSIASSENNFSVTNAEEFKEIENYWEILTKVTSHFYLNDELIDNVTMKKFPKPLREIICSYDIPLDRLQHFSIFKDKTKYFPQDITDFSPSLGSIGRSYR